MFESAAQVPITHTQRERTHYVHPSVPLVILWYDIEQSVPKDTQFCSLHAALSLIAVLLKTLCPTVTVYWGTITDTHTSPCPLWKQNTVENLHFNFINTLLLLFSSWGGAVWGALTLHLRGAHSVDLWNPPPLCQHCCLRLALGYNPCERLSFKIFFFHLFFLTYSHLLQEEEISRYLLAFHSWQLLMSCNNFLCLLPNIGLVG